MKKVDFENLISDTKKLIINFQVNEDYKNISDSLYKISKEIALNNDALDPVYDLINTLKEKEMESEAKDLEISLAYVVKDVA